MLDECAERHRQRFLDCNDGTWDISDAASMDRLRDALHRACVGLTNMITRCASFTWLRHTARPRDGFKLLPGPEQQRTLYRRGRAVLKRYLQKRSREQQKKMDFQVCVCTQHAAASCPPAPLAICRMHAHACP